MRFLSIVIAFILLSCKKDITPPVIGEIALNQHEDTLLINLDTNTKVYIECLIEDDADLSQLRLFSANIISGVPSDSSIFQNFVYSMNKGIDSNPYFLMDSINIGSNTCTGLYSIDLSAIDTEGNEGHGDEFVLWVFSSEAPSTNISSPDFANMAYAAGDTIYFQGTITDNIALKNIYFNLYDQDGLSIASNEYNYSDTIIPSWDYTNNNAQIQLPTVMETGHYLMRIRIIDNDGNLTLFQDSVIVN